MRRILPRILQPRSWATRAYVRDGFMGSVSTQRDFGANASVTATYSSNVTTLTATTPGQRRQLYANHQLLDRHHGERGKQRQPLISCVYSTALECGSEACEAAAFRL